MPVRDVEEYVADAVESVLGQTFTDFEFLIIDDQSGDRTVEIVRSFKDARIRLISDGKRRHFAGALNHGFGLACGEYIARMDADDICMPARFERQVSFMSANPEVGICGTWAQTFGLGKRTVFKMPADWQGIRAASLFDCPFSHPSVVLRRSVVDRYSIRYDGDYYPTEDFELWERIVHEVPCANISEPLVRYRLRDSGMTVGDWSRMDRQAVRVVRRGLCAMGLEPTDEQAEFHRSVGRGQSHACRTYGELRCAEEWLAGLLDANAGSRYYDEQALAVCVAEVWFRVCFHSLGLGSSVVKTYGKSQLVRGERERVRCAILLMLAGLKRLIVGRRKEVTE